MASFSPLTVSMRALALQAVRSSPSASVKRTRSHTLRRSMATVVEESTPSSRRRDIPDHLRTPPVLATMYNFPSMEPECFQTYEPHHLSVPLRRDILHRAIVYEGDKTRQGTASTKWRREVHGSTRKLAPQKGTGNARVGDKKSPIRVGGGRAFGPKPRDFSTGLQKKVYDLAFRMALSYRYRRGELIIVHGDAELPETAGALTIEQIFGWNRMGKGFKGTRIITSKERENLFMAMEESKNHGVASTWHDVDVKDLLMGGSIVIEAEALSEVLKTHP